MLSEKTIADGTQDIKISTSSLLSSTDLIKQFVWYMYLNLLRKKIYLLTMQIYRDRPQCLKSFFFQFEVVKLITDTSSIFFFYYRV